MREKSACPFLFGRGSLISHGGHWVVVRSDPSQVLLATLQVTTLYYSLLALRLDRFYHVHVHVL